MPYDPSGTLATGVSPFASSGASQLAQVIEQARQQLASQPQRVGLPDIGEPLVGDGGQFSSGTDVGNKAADIGSRLGYGAMQGLINLPQRALQASAGDVQHLGQEGYDPQSVGPAVDTALTMMGGSGVVPAEANSLRMGIKAYHGSPHDFDAFDLSKIGTGEGAQAYGHGLYFADREGTAQSYRDQLSGQPMLEGGVDPFKDMPWMGRTQKDLASWQIKNALADGMSGDEAVMTAAKKLNDMGHGLDDNFVRQPYYDAANAITQLRGKKWEVSPGKMYEVNINADPEHFLDWDKRLDEHPPATQDAIKQAMGIDYYGKQDPAKAERMWQEFKSANSGTAVRQGFIASDDKLVADRLNQAGIPGIKYLDQGSRAAGDGSRNYVVFDPKMIDIMRKYGMIGAIPAAGAGFGGLAQQGQPSVTN